MMVKNGISSDMIGKWLTAWSLSRELPLPIKYESGYKMDVGYEKQKARFVFPELNEDFIKLSVTIDEPCVFLKVCAPPEEVKNKINSKWVIQPQGYMMSCVSPMNISNKTLPQGYKVEVDHYNLTTVVRIVTTEGKLACIGRLIVVDYLAVYDRIVTEKNHKRKGLATFLIKELEKHALSINIHENLLVATEEGKLLYQSLGWKIYSLYTSIVIPNMQTT